MKYNLYGKTWENRYPVIFSNCKKIHKDPKDILSFGCSTGEECITLKNYFPNSSITGVEIDKERLKEAKIKNKNKKIYYLNYLEFLKDKKYFDMIFCMGVFCKWPETETVEDCSKIFEFEQFEKEIKFLNKKLKLNGLFVIFNCSFFFEQTSVAKYFEPIYSTKRREDIKKFEKTNKASNNLQKHYIFKKHNII